ncbi:MAG: cellulase family glycosylhydrolase [Candidatus Binataceae bacterium]
MLANRRRPRRFAAITVAAVALTMCALTCTIAAAGESYGRLSHAGRWITDARGRVLIFHGMNVPTKSAPVDSPAALGFNSAHAAFLARLGFNAVRITVERYAVEPTPGQFDAAYVRSFAKTIRMLARHGILSLIDFHQDEYGPVFHDNGYPDWMTVTDGLTNNWQVGFPYQYFENPALLRAYDHLWANDPDTVGQPLYDDDAAILTYVVKGLRNEPGILGYEIINEPWPGSQWTSCVSPTGCPALDQSLLGAYYNRVIPAIRAADKKHIIWYEPFSTFNFGVPTGVMPAADPNRGFAFHDYSLCLAAGCNSADQDAMVMTNALAQTSATGDALLQTEFDAVTPLDPPVVTAQVNLYDRNMIPWMFWAYNSEVVSVNSEGILLPPTGSNVFWPILDIVDRPYPQLVSGTPQSWYFDPTTDIFTMEYSTARADGTGNFPAGSKTRIYVPALQYPNGYQASITGGIAVSRPGASLLQVKSCQGASAVSVTVWPSTGSSTVKSMCCNGRRTCVHQIPP